MHETQTSKGLYDSRFEHDSCGVGFVADLNNIKSHDIIQKGLEILVNLDHRGARGAEPDSGDGAGMLVQIPHAFFLRECSKLGIALPEPGDYGIGQCFLPQDRGTHAAVKQVFRRALGELGLDVLGWREVPTDDTALGATARSREPVIAQPIIRRLVSARTQAEFERRLFVARKYAIRMVRESVTGAAEFYICSMSSRTIVYKGMLTPGQMPGYFPDLVDESFMSALALIHSRFSTNTLPTWPLAHPYRTLAHNGEINTVRGNLNWMRSREAVLESSLFSRDEIQKMRPIAQEGGSDTGILDNVVEFLMMGGRSLPHVMMMLIPEAWEKDPEIPPARKAFYEYHGGIIEPWDGPASVVFSDGTLIGATLDRNGLRPSRYCLTDDNILIMASEAGVLTVPPEKVVLKGRLQPGKMFVASLEEGRIIPDEEIKARVCAEAPYQEWIDQGKIPLSELEPPRQILQPPTRKVLTRQKAFGYSLEDLRILMAPMVRDGQEPVGSMGNDTPLAVLSDKSRSLFDYFQQLFAQVTNPPIDPIREELVMSLVSFVGGEGNLLEAGPEHARLIELPHPVLTNEDLERLRWVDQQHFQAKTISIAYEAKPGRMERALDRLRREAEEYVLDGYEVIILTDRTVDSDHAAIPSLLAVSAVHHHLIRVGLRSRCGLVVETGEAREVHHFASLLGFGASAVNPYLAFETIEDLRLRQLLPDSLSEVEAREHYVKAVNKGLLKTMSKMGISTVSSYIGAQIFEAVGVADKVIDEFFPGTTSRVGGIDIATIERESLMRHGSAYVDIDDETDLELGGLYQWRLRGERHLHDPDRIHKLQQAVRTNDYGLYREYARVIDDNSDTPITLRHLLDFTDLAPVPIEEVEPVEEIVKRFATGAMSFGSISWEAHTTLAIAMNRLGAKSNTGEGGEDPVRFETLPNGDSMRSAIKQVASGRFGVTSDYLVNADELQIKMAQGAKPGEGGQLPGHKVDKGIARVRHSTPYVGLISPPPHHDIYSIEDLKQLIYDLKNSNPRARINVKLVAEVGVGTIAAGVAKAHADVILISGHDGGTGASPLSSIKHAGLPWELGLSEAHQVLMRNNLRDRVVLQTDGLLRTGRDIAIATLLGAEEWGVATGALIAMGCIMMRKCHLNTCPVGVATQDKELRALFSGDPDHVVNFFRFIAEDLREHMARLGFRTVNEMVGRVDKVAPRKDVKHFKASQLDLSRLLQFMPPTDRTSSFHSSSQDHRLDEALDNHLTQLAAPALERGEHVEAAFDIRNVHRTVGTLLGQEITRRTGGAGLPEDTIHFKATGSAGQSFMAFAPAGLTIELEGEANDYFGKGLSGGTAILYPAKASVFDPNENVICGNVSFYGATSGKAFILGPAGERFCVRNSGAQVVVEGVGDHGCEYMTGGRAVILGPVGRNFAAGMSGGIAYLWDEGAIPRSRINHDMVDLEELLEAGDIAELQALIEEHARVTDSQRARRILADWERQVGNFVKVMPRDYKRALAELAAEAEICDRDGGGVGSEMGKDTGFKDYERQVPAYEPPDERIRHWQEFALPMAQEQVQIQGARCMDCGVPFCHDGCPLGNVIPDFNDHVYHGKWQRALKALYSTNNFPEFTGRVCPAPCESACVLSINEPAVTIKNIEVSIIERAFEEGWATARPPSHRSGRSVAIVGSGPSGLAAADQLNRAGHSVTVFERADRIGGLLRYGIPDFKLSKDSLDRRLDLMKTEGVRFRTGTNVGLDYPASQLIAHYDAVVLAGGSTMPRDLPIPGREATGVEFAMDFLRQANRRVAGDDIPPGTDILATGKDVVVIGGGDTGSDCVGTSIRQGARSVTQVEILPRPPEGRTAQTPWPVFPGPRMFSTSTSQAEGAERDWDVMSKEFLADDTGALRAIRATRADWSSGRPEEVAGSEHELPAQLVLLAMGFLHPEHAAMDDLGVDKDDRGNCASNGYRTSRDGVFVAGDMRRGQSLVVWAISEGRECARDVDEYLTGRPSLLGAKTLSRSDVVPVG